MNIVVVGSGGIGGYFGAKLARAGGQVTFLARGAHLEAMRRHGLAVRSAVEGEWRVDVDATDSLEGRAEADLVLFCVKAFDTEEAAEAARPVVGPRTAVLSLQNGIDNEEKIARVLGPEHVLGGIAYIFSNIESPGVIAHHQLGRIVLGEPGPDGDAGGVTGRVEDIAALLTDAGIDAEPDEHIRRALWRKYVFLVPLSGATAVTRLPVRWIRDVPETRELWRRQLEELLALADADNAGLEAGTMRACEQLLESLGPDNYSSLYHDLAAGKRLELDALHGHALRLGRQHDVPTPTVFAVHAALAPYRDGAPV